jgi:ElaB/YqjD/DUF883 family membrane-anchored ribosome-binding protein
VFKQKISRQAQKELAEIKKLTTRITELTDALNESKAEVKEFSPKAGKVHWLFHGRIGTDPADAKRLRAGKKGVRNHSGDIERHEDDLKVRRERLERLLEPWAERNDSEYGKAKKHQGRLLEAKQACTTMSGHVDEVHNAIADSHNDDSDRIVTGIGTIEEYTASFNKQVKPHGSLKLTEIRRLRNKAQAGRVEGQVAGILEKIDEELAVVAGKLRERLTQIRSDLES